jgi:signal transduction histidine kinase/ligand-binding sensor domain-containing protein/DNA-binding response OmpR family regulator
MKTITPGAPHRLLLLACIALPLVATTRVSAQNTLMFRQLSTVNGMSNNSITALCRDTRGFLWIGTASGLNRYDSYSFQQYYQDTDNLPDNGITDIFEDHTGNLWVGTSHGHAVYDYQTGKFTRDVRTRAARLNIICDTIMGAGTDLNKNYFWVYDHSKIYLHDYRTSVTKIYPLVDTDLTRLSITDQYIYTIYNSGRLYSTNISSSLTQEIDFPTQYDRFLEKHFPRVYTDNEGGLWVYTYQNSLLLYRRNAATPWHEVKLPVHTEQFNRIRDLAEDAHGNIWLITSHLGAFIYQPASATLTHLTHDPLRGHSLAGDNLSAIHIDHEGIVWIGNFKHGISYYVPRFQVFLSQKLPRYGDILAFDENDEGLWLGTDGGGLMFRPNGAALPHQIPTPANVVVTLRRDSRQRLWLGCFQNGLICYDRGRLTQYTMANSGLLGNDVYGIQEDRHGRIWISTLDGYIQKLDPATGTFTTVFDMQHRLNINQLLYDGRQTLYAATSQGLLLVNTDDNRCRFVRTNASTRQDLTSQHLYTLFKDSRNILWMGGTQGLTYWNLDTDTIGYIDRTNGLPANMVTAIDEDNNNQIWVGTCNGIVRINLAHERFSIIAYDATDGLTANNVNERALYKLRSGNMLVGSPDGYTIIVPREEVSDTYRAEVYLTGIEPKYYPISDMLDGRSPEYANAITMPEGIPFLGLQFSTLDFIAPRKVHFAYRIKGQHNFWTPVVNNQIDFSMLTAGRYELQVAVSNSEYSWSPNVRTITLNVLPPWYRTTWAYTLYTLVIALILWRNIAYFYARRKRQLALQAITREDERRQKMTDMKMQFFANVSHELRTPLSLIINPLEEFLNHYPQYRNTLLFTAQKNARYLLELINQLLDFRKLDADGEVMRYAHTDLIALVRDQYKAFESMARQRAIDYRLVTPLTELQMDFDYDKMRKIVLNILSNAFKFTERGGQIELAVRHEGNLVVLQFSDTGCGIDDAQKQHIFQCFYQSDAPQSSLGGSGIGLYLVGQYVKMHKGTITVADNTPHGTRFTLALPLHADATATADPAADITPLRADPYAHNYTILLVDDNDDFLDFLSACLVTGYNVLKASDGREALELLKRENVDLVISDVMMPQVDGLQLCTAIKNDIRTSHIPIILLTARASDEHQLEGLGHGADDYITKPFNMEVLKLRINKFIDSSLKKHKLFDEQVKIEPARITITPLDRSFVEQAISIVEENIDNADFSVEELAERLNISRGYLYKKMVKITGKTSLEFIRIIRMKRAQQLLEESQLQVAEIAYRLGYNSPKIFTKHFKEAFRMRPSDVARKG